MPEWNARHFSERCAWWQAIAADHGCVFRNLYFHETEDGSVCAMAVRKNEPVELRVTQPLLIDRQGIELKENSQRVLPLYCADHRLRAVLDDMLGYIMGTSRLNDLRELYRSFSQLPQALATRLSETGLASHLISQKVPDWFSAKARVPKQRMPARLEPNGHSLRERLLSSRLICRTGGVKIFMPFVDFINHDADGLSYLRYDDAIAVSGYSSETGEVFAFYNRSDTWGLLNTYGFPGNSSFAYSACIGFVSNDGTKIRIDRLPDTFDLDAKGLRRPRIAREGETITLSNVWIGALGEPEKPYRSFAAAWGTLGRDDALVIFGHIVRYNWTLMRELRMLSRNVDTLAGEFVRTALERHMRVLGEQQVG